MHGLRLLIACLALLQGSPGGAEEAAEKGRYFKITVVDQETGRPVPLVELETVNNIRSYTDSNGVVAFDEPGLRDQPVFFYVRSHGYLFPKDGFGIRGTRLDVKRGGSAVLRIQRINIAERLYRLTGGGIYRDSLLLGERVPIREPVLNGKVLGQDSVQNAVYRGKLYWFWGDTNRPAYPLGNFNMSGATSLLPSQGGLDPEVGVELTYFVDQEGFARGMAPVPGEGPTWIDGPIVLRRGPDQERMFAPYAKVRGNMEAYQRGLLEFNEGHQRFEKVAEFELKAPCLPAGHPFQWTEDSVERVYFPHPFPLVRAPADPDRLRDLANYEAYTCLKEGSRLEKPELDRGPDGKLRYGWKRNTPPAGPAEEELLMKAGGLKRHELLLHTQDAETGKPIRVHGGSVYWNEYRRRWVMILLEIQGTSLLGEIWFAEADTPLGPWVYTRKVVTHESYSFYNPRHHVEFDKEGGRIIFFEGTYTATFSGNPVQTPRYDYNQILYKLDLSDPRLILPVPVYDVSTGRLPNRFATAEEARPEPMRWRIGFFAPDRPAPGTLPVFAAEELKGGLALRVGDGAREAAGGKPKPLFHALPADAKDPPATTTPLYEFVGPENSPRAYSTEASWSEAGYRRSEKPLCRVWRSPYQASPAP